MKVNARRIRIQTNGAPYLNASLGIDGAGQFNFALPPFRKFSKGVRTVIDHIGIAYPVLFIVVSFRQQPDLVAAVVEPPVRDCLYYLVPALWKRQGLYSSRLVSWHFWIATLGIVLYITSMWVSGIMQGLMWRAYDQFGFLQYSFVETVAAMHPYYIIRASGGVLFLLGALIMVYNVWRTIRGDVRQETKLPATATAKA